MMQPMGGGGFVGPPNANALVALIILLVFVALGGGGWFLYWLGSSVFSSRGYEDVSVSSSVEHSAGTTEQSIQLSEATVGEEPEESHSSVPGKRMLLQIFKESGEAEIWSSEDAEHFALEERLALCAPIEKIGRKRETNDDVLPEGFYHVPDDLLAWYQEKRPKQLPIGYPNTFDLGRGVSVADVSVQAGCEKGDDGKRNGFRFPTKQMEKILASVAAAKAAGQRVFPIHVFPFRMEWHRLSDEKGKKDYNFWLNLKEVYDYFQKRRRVPFIGVCGMRYWMTVSEREGNERVKDDYSCIPLLPGSEVPFSIAKEHTWLRSALEDHRLAFWQSKRAISAIEVKCNLKRPSCRRWYTLRKQMIKDGKVLPEWSGR